MSSVPRPRPLGSPSPRAPLALFATRATSLALAVALASLVLAGCASGGSSSVHKPAATPTTPPAPRVLYQSDFVHHASEWTLPPQWRFDHGVLVNDGSSPVTVTLAVPYDVTAAQYTVTVVMRILAAKGVQVQDTYGILVQAPDGHRLVTATMSEVERTLHSYTQFYPAKPDPDVYGNNFGVSDYTPGTNPQPYVVQVDGVYATFVASGGQIGGDIESIEKLSPARVIILAQSMDMTIQSVTITTP